jgi:uncharacterized protein YjbI with pentapeptide repeats
VNTRIRTLCALTALALGAGFAPLTGTAAQAAAVTCPTVNSSTGDVSPAPTPGVDWLGCNLTGASLTGADLSDADLEGTILDNANLTNANLTSSDLGGAQLNDTSFSGATLTGVQSGDITTLGGSVTLPTDWTLYLGYLLGPGADLVGASFVRLTTAFGAVDLEGANLTDASFVGTQLDGTDLQDANLTGADFTSALLENVNVSGAQFAGADFFQLDLLFDNLSSVVPVNGQAASLPQNWTEAGNYFFGPTVYIFGSGGVADLSGLNLTGADLWAANLLQTSLSGTNLTKADLYGAAIPADATATWSDTVCPDGTNSDANGSSCDNDLTPVPVAFPTVNGANVTFGAPGWYMTEGQQVTWNWTDLNGGINPGACPATSTSSGEGAAVKVTASCPDAEGGVGTQTVTLRIDASEPKVAVTGVRNRQAYALGHVPVAGCKATDSLSGISTQATVKITPAATNSPGVYKATCSGAVTGAGMRQADPVSATYEVAYGFAGFHAPKPGAKVRATHVLEAAFRLVGGKGKPLPAKTAAALARAGQMAVTLAGPGIHPVTSRCSWKDGYFHCAITVPAHVMTGRSDAYTLTATEKIGKVTVAAPAVGKAANPLRFRFS